MISGVVLTGIAAGGLVFVGTLAAVFLLLRGGGSFERMAQEAVGLPARLGEEKPLLYDELLLKARTLATRPSLAGATDAATDAATDTSAVLEGERVCVRELSLEQDAAQLFAISQGEPCAGIYRDLRFDADELIWRYLPHGPFTTEKDFCACYSSERPDARHLVLADRATAQPIGMVTLATHSPTNLRVELADLWLAPAFQGTGVLTETVLLLLTRLFAAGYRRVEWRCDGHNVRARRAAHSLGFSFEGVLRKHRIVKNCNCDTVVFAAINSEWPAMQDHLQSKLRHVQRRQQTEQESKKAR